MKKLKIIITVAIMFTLALVMLTACPNGNGYENGEAHTVSWTATGATVTATVGGEAITSGSQVENATIVVFSWNAPSEGYRMRITVGENAPQHRERNVTTFTQAITSDTSITFTVVPVQTTAEMFTVTWTGAGVTSAEVTSGGQVTNGTNVTFNWTQPAEGFRMRIIVNEGTAEYLERSVTTFSQNITADINIAFAIVPVIVETQQFTISWTMPSWFTIVAMVDGNEINSGSLVLSGESIMFLWGEIPDGYSVRIVTDEVDRFELEAGYWILESISSDREVAFTLEERPFTLNGKWRLSEEGLVQINAAIAELGGQLLNLNSARALFYAAVYGDAMYLNAGGGGRWLAFKFEYIDGEYVGRQFRAGIEHVIVFDIYERRMTIRFPGRLLSGAFSRFETVDLEFQHDHHVDIVFNETPRNPSVPSVGEGIFLSASSPNNNYSLPAAYNHRSVQLGFRVYVQDENGEFVFKGNAPQTHQFPVGALGLDAGVNTIRLIAHGGPVFYNGRIVVFTESEARETTINIDSVDTSTQLTSPYNLQFSHQTIYWNTRHSSIGGAGGRLSRAVYYELWVQRGGVGEFVLHSIHLRATTFNGQAIAGFDDGDVVRVRAGGYSASLHEGVLVIQSPSDFEEITITSAPSNFRIMGEWLVWSSRIAGAHSVHLSRDGGPFVYQTTRSNFPYGVWLGHGREDFSFTASDYTIRVYAGTVSGDLSFNIEEIVSRQFEAPTDITVAGQLWLSFSPRSPARLHWFYVQLNGEGDFIRWTGMTGIPLATALNFTLPAGTHNIKIRSIAYFQNRRTFGFEETENGFLLIEYQDSELSEAFQITVRTHQVIGQTPSNFRMDGDYTIQWDMPTGGYTTSFQHVFLRRQGETQFIGLGTFIAMQSGVIPYITFNDPENAGNIFALTLPEGSHELKVYFAVPTEWNLIDGEIHKNVSVATTVILNVDSNGRITLG
ncbi:MAG: hypothetical protein FWC11_04620 [Firmicutes bacterium]|nr:hypothetical protein [Bacillota bacterium]